MYALNHNFPGRPQPTPVALAGSCPHRPWDADQRSNANTLAERRVR
jgi:hypothetical protein